MTLSAPGSWRSDTFPARSNTNRKSTPCRHPALPRQRRNRHPHRERHALRPARKETFPGPLRVCLNFWIGARLARRFPELGPKATSWTPGTMEVPPHRSRTGFSESKPNFSSTNPETLSNRKRTRSPAAFPTRRMGLLPLAPMYRWEVFERCPPARRVPRVNRARGAPNDRPTDPRRSRRLPWLWERVAHWTLRRGYASSRS